MICNISSNSNPLHIKSRNKFIKLITSYWLSMKKLSINLKKVLKFLFMFYLEKQTIKISLKIPKNINLV